MKTLFLLILMIPGLSLCHGQSMDVHTKSGVDRSNISDIDSITFGSSAQSDTSRLAVLWTSGDPEVAEKVCFMYTHAAKKSNWFDEVLLIVWGPSSRLLTENTALQSRVASMMSDGVTVQACITCANMYGVTQDLRDLGIEVKGMGSPLTNILKSDWKVLTF